MSAKIIPFHKPIPQKPNEVFEQEVARLVNDWVEKELARFAESLVCARMLFRKYPELVKAAKFPEHLRKPYMEGWEGDNPDDPAVDYGAPRIPPRLMREFREQARKFVQESTRDAG